MTSNGTDWWKNYQVKPGNQSMLKVSGGWLLRFLDLHKPSPQTMLDLGTGKGRYAIWFAKHGFEVTAVDVSPALLAEATRRATEADAKVQFIEKDFAELEELKLPEKSFGLIFDRNSSQFMSRDKQERYFDTVAKLLAPAGVLLYEGLIPAGPTPAPVTNYIGVTGDDAQQLIAERFSIVLDKTIPSTNLPDTNVRKVVARPKTDQTLADFNSDRHQD